MAENAIITIIIPVYNVEPFLTKCVDSVLNQTYEHLEIILVDDGSTDGSPEICDEYEKKDPRIKVIHQENRGLSGARNTGLEHTTTDVLMFLDSDDEILPTMVETLWYIMKKTGADISQCGFTQIVEGEPLPEIDRETVFREKSVGEIHTLSGKEKLIACQNDWHFVVQWNKLFRRKIFDDIRFPEGRYHEDEYVIFPELLAANMLAYTEKKLHLYYRHKASITWNPSMEKNFHKCEAFLGQTIVLAENGHEDLAKNCYNRLGVQSIYCLERKQTLSKAREFYPKIRAIKKEADLRFPQFKDPTAVRLKKKIHAHAFAVKYRLWIMKNRILSWKK